MGIVCGTAGGGGRPFGGHVMPSESPDADHGASSFGFYLRTLTLLWPDVFLLNPNSSIFEWENLFFAIVY